MLTVEWPVGNFLTLLGDLVTDTYCWVHDVIEPRSKKSYLVCFECGHVYGTTTALESAYIRNAPDRADALIANKRAADIGFCPFCLHDF